MENKEKYYTRSNGEQVALSSMEFTHLSNSLAKKYREIFESKNKDEFSEKLNTINDIKEEMHKRINQFNDTLGE